ncbi:hypothetical protein [Lysinibacillus sp. FSL W8-0992]
MSVKEGFVPQENGTGFLLKKNNNLRKVVLIKDYSVAHVALFLY